MNRAKPATIREARLEETLRMTLFDGFTYGTGCSLRDCICRIPGAACDEFMGTGDYPSAKCPRCGWDLNAHESLVPRGQHPPETQD